MSDWENDDEPVAQPPAAPKLTAGRKKFDDEDVEDQIKDDWEEEDSEPEAAINSRSAVVLPAQKKKSVKQKIAEKEEEERKRRELGLGGEEDSDDFGEWDEDPIAKKRMEREAQLKSDVENAANLLGTSKISADDDSSISALKSANPQSKEDWEGLSDSIFNDLIKGFSTKPGFEKHFVNHLFKNVCSTMRDVEIRKTSVALKTYAEEKVKLEKEAKKLGGQKKAPKPKTVGTASAKNVIDTRAYGDEALDDDLDFM